MTKRSDALRLFSVATLAAAGIGAAPLAALAQADAKPAPATPPGTATAPATAEPAKTDPRKAQTIRELITLSGQEQSLRTAIPLIVRQYQGSVPDAPAGFWDQATKKFTDAIPVFAERLVPVYAARYSQEELDSIVAFYKTPAGQKMAKETSPIQSQTATVGREWIQEIAGKVQADLQTAQAKAAPPAGAASATKTTFDKKPFKTSGKVVKTASGLQYDDMTVGKGKTAVAGKTAVVHYTGTLKDGTKFDSSRDRGQPFDFVLGAGNVIKGWDQGVAGMKVGGRRKLIIPANLGYGASGTPGGPIPPNAVLTFDVELIDVK